MHFIWNFNSGKVRRELLNENHVENLPEVDMVGDDSIAV